MGLSWEVWSGLAFARAELNFDVIPRDRPHFWNPTRNVTRAQIQ